MRIISGMHRSGTSLVARLAYEAGAPMGKLEEFYRPDKWNPEGYYEFPEIHAINMPLINGPWRKLAYFHLPSTRTLLRRASRRESEIRRAVGLYQGMVLKETRFCLTLPAWQEYGASIDAVIFCLRDPIQVACSLRRRNKIPLSLGMKLWVLHNQRLLENCDAVPITFVYYNDLLDQRACTGEIRRMFAALRLEVGDEAIESFQSKVVKPGMNHHPRIEYPYPEAVRRLWDALRQRHAAQLRSTSGDPSRVER